MLTAKERNIIRSMCAIAGALGIGEGDYQGWTQGDFDAADRLLHKMLEPDPGLELLRALQAAVDVMAPHHAHRDVSRVLARCNKLIAKHQGAK